MNEPPTSARVVIHTTKGNIELELWAKETPNISRSFIASCVDGSLIGRKFDDLIANFGISISSLTLWKSEKSAQEINDRLRFNRRGLLGTYEGSFIITLGENCSTLQGSSTLFGKVVNESIYTVIEISRSGTNDKGEILYPAKITKCEVLEKYFHDLEISVQREEKASKQAPVAVVGNNKKRKQVSLSFDGEEENEDDEGVPTIRLKSVHDLTNGQQKKTTKKPELDENVEDKTNVLEQVSNQGAKPLEAINEGVTIENGLALAADAEAGSKGQEQIEQAVEPPSMPKAAKSNGISKVDKMKAKYADKYKLNQKQREEQTLKKLNSFIKKSTTSKSWN